MNLDQRIGNNNCHPLEEVVDAKDKGRRLFGERRSRRHEGLRQYVCECIRSSLGLDVLGTSSVTLTNLAANTRGGMRTVAAADEARTEGFVFGRELVPLLNLLKRVANDAGIQGRVDIILDRSHQLGLDPSDRGLAADEFETFGPGDLNALASGAAANIQSNCSFRIVSVSDEGSFRNLVLLPDAVGYIGAFCGDAFDGVKARVLGGEAFWHQRVSPETFPCS